jgi:hypothetical protein
MMKLIDLKLRLGNEGLRGLIAGLHDATGDTRSPCAEIDDATAANVFHAAITLLEIGDSLTEVKDAEALRGVLFDVAVIAGNLGNRDIFDIFPDGGEVADHLSQDCPKGHGFYPFDTPANVCGAGRALMNIADVHDKVA